MTNMCIIPKCKYVCVSHGVACDSKQYEKCMLAVELSIASRYEPDDDAKETGGSRASTPATLEEETGLLY
ncbi:hypothetical protein Ancab_011864 [Ancistrocladus abbreviatus]